jgi:hypothetical protein
VFQRSRLNIEHKYILDERREMTKKKDEIIYYISVSDIQEVAEEELDRELSPEEIKLVQERVGDYISWYDAIWLAIDELVVRNKNRS